MKPAIIDLMTDFYIKKIVEITSNTYGNSKI